MIPVRALCAKYHISDEKWKVILSDITQHLLLVNLFPKSDSESGIVTEIMDGARLTDKDKYGEIYSMVSRAFMSSGIYFLFGHDVIIHELTIFHS